MFTRTSGVGYVMRIRVKLIRDGGVRNDTMVVYELYDVVNESRRCRVVNGVCASVHVRQTHVRVLCGYGEAKRKRTRGGGGGEVSNEIRDAAAFYYNV